MAIRDYTPQQLFLPIEGLDIEFPLPKGRAGIISAADGDLLWHRWGVAQRYINRTSRKYGHVKLHRVIMERILGRAMILGEVVDHINGNTFDNRRCNLRLATPQLNSANSRRPKNNTSGHKGVRFHHGKWCAQIKVDQVNIHLGSFDTEQEAIEAYTQAAEQHFGEFAKSE